MEALILLYVVCSALAWWYFLIETRGNPTDWIMGVILARLAGVPRS